MTVDLQQQADSARQTTDSQSGIPQRTNWLFQWFHWYSKRYVRKHFHAVRVAHPGYPTQIDNGPTLVVMNHPSWWDAMVPFCLVELFPASMEHFAAIDARALLKYPFFSRLGFFGIEPDSVTGAKTFLRVGGNILSQPGRCVWVTGQGRFADVRSRPVDLRSGVGHLAARMQQGYVLPLAVEYPFWTERTPEAAFRFGTPLSIDCHKELSGKAWTALIEDELTRTMDQLAVDCQSRDDSRFQTLALGRSGVGGVYDQWRRLIHRLRGKPFDPSHGNF